MTILYDNLFNFILLVFILFICFLQIFYPKIKVTPKQIEVINFLYDILNTTTIKIKNKIKKKIKLIY